MDRHPAAGRRRYSRRHLIRKTQERQPDLNGAEALLHTLVATGVDVCFANPGTSEMHFVAALDAAQGMRSVLTLFEGVATGAADGYGRMTGRPAAVLLHLGPGLGNGIANLHNARRAHTPVVVVVGDHATYHKRYDAPLESDIDALAGSVSGWVQRSSRAEDVGHDTASAVAASAAGSVATLILPADVSWSDGGQPAPGRTNAAADVDEQAEAAAVGALRAGESTVLLVGGDATGPVGLAAASRIAEATGARLLCENFPARLTRGAGVPAVQRVAYYAETAQAQLAGARHAVLAGAGAPVAFFAYPGRASDLLPAGCTVHRLAGRRGAALALERLADVLAPRTRARVAPAGRPGLPSGPLSAASVAAVVGALLPEGAVVVDEANTGGRGLGAATAGAPPHDLLTNTGGAVGLGLAAAVGAAVAVPDRPVLVLQADGSAMFTISALWTHAREQLDVTTVILNNGAYDILRIELQRVGAGTGAPPGPKAQDLMDLGRPDLDFVRLAEGMGLPARRARTAEELADALRWALAEPGPHLVEAVVPSILG